MAHNVEAALERRYRRGMIRYRMWIVGALATVSLSSVVTADDGVKKQRPPEDGADVPPPAAAKPPGKSGFEGTYSFANEELPGHTELLDHGRCLVSPTRPLVIANGQLSLWFTMIQDSMSKLQDKDAIAATWIHALADVKRDGTFASSFALTPETTAYINSHPKDQYANDLKAVSQAVIQGKFSAAEGGHVGDFRVTIPGMHFENGGRGDNEWCSFQNIHDAAYKPDNSHSCMTAGMQCNSNAGCCSGHCVGDPHKNEALCR